MENHTGPASGGPVGGLIGAILSIFFSWSFPEGTVETIFLAFVGGAVGWMTQEGFKLLGKRLKKKHTSEKVEDNPSALRASPLEGEKQEELEDFEDQL